MTSPKLPGTPEAAIARAAKPLGGVTNAGLALGKDRYTVAHAANPNKPEMLRWDDAIALDQLCYDACGEAPLLAYHQASLAPEDGPQASALAYLSSVARASGALMSNLAEAAADGRLTAAERRAALDHVEALQSHLSGLTETLKAGDA